MTRETRIGLLVGLGFIIMFGLVLTELTGSGKPAPLPSSLRDDAGQLAAATAEEVSPSIIDHNHLVPRLGQPISTPPTQAPTMVLSGSTEQPQAQPARADQPGAGQPEIVAVIGQPAPDAAAARQDETARTSSGPIVTLAAEIASAAEVAAQPPTPQQTYLVQPKDSLMKIAVKFYGKGHEADYRPIYEANKAALKSPSSIRPGQKLLIPPHETAVAAAPARGPAAQAAGQQLDLAQLGQRFAPSPQAPAAPAQSARPTGRTTYTVKRGDTLTKIARQTLNDGSRAAVAKILAANKDKLSHPDRLAVGLELVIPG